ncbi:MAG: NADH-quinone oxidoreductase subunit J [Deltaproteobacteria bacterium]
MAINIVFLVIMTAAAVWAVMTRSLLRSAIALALASAVVSVLMFRLCSPLAAVFELSVCSGLISVLFISTISLTQAETREEKAAHLKARLKRFGLLPLLVVVLGVILAQASMKLNASPVGPETVTDPRAVLWNERPLDLIGQVIILLAGVFGVVLLFKERDKR